MNLIVVSIFVSAFMLVHGSRDCTGHSHRNRVVEESNRKLVLDFYQAIFGDKDFSAFDKNLSPNYIQHNPLIADGREAIKAAAPIFLKDSPKRKLDILRTAADGDLVWVHQKMIWLGKLSSVMDVFRVKDGLIVEHWDVIQAVPEHSENNNTMF